MPIRKRQTKRNDYKIVIVGDSGVGKTSLFQHYLGCRSNNSQRISSVDFRNKRMSLHDKDITLSLWDTTGQQQFRSIISGYLKSANGLLIVFDLTDTVSWANAQTVWHDLASTFAPDAPCILVGNKSDLAAAVPKEEISVWCKAKQIYFIEASAQTGFHVKETVMTLAAMVDVQCDRSWGKKKGNGCEADEEDACKEASVTTAETKDSVRAKYGPGKSIPTLKRDSMNCSS